MTEKPRPTVFPLAGAVASGSSAARSGVLARPMQSVLIVEDHALTAAMVRELLIRAMPHLCVHVAASVKAALETFARVRPMIAIVDVGLPDGSGLDVIRRLVAERPAIHVAVHSGHDSAIFQEAARKAGAHAFVGKQSSRTLVAVVQAFLDGDPLQFDGMRTGARENSGESSRRGFDRR